MVDTNVHDRARAALAESRAHMTCESPEPLGAFFIGSAPVGRLVSAVRNKLTQDNYRSLVRTSPIGQKLVAAESVEERTLALEALLVMLRKDGLLGPATGEAVDILYHGELLARVDRSAVRLLGLPTRVVRLLAATSDGRWVLQKRSDKKRIAPGLLDNFAAGMVAAGETVREALRRETAEETGLALSLSDEQEALLRFKCARPVEEGFLFEENVVFRTTLPDGFSPKGEREEVAHFVKLGDSEILDAVTAAKLMPEAAHAFLTLFAND